MLEKESYRKDQTRKLGMPLSRGEGQIYSIIHSAGAESITTDELYKQHFGLKVERNGDRILVWSLISRARQKLGKHSIISLREPGNGTKYMTRRSLIENASSS